jgi:hypothetical protein
MSKRGLAFILVSQLFLAVFLIPSSATGLTWSSDKLLFQNLNPDYAPSITQTSDHKVWVTWQKDMSSTNTIFYTVSSDYGFTWAPEKNITTFPSYDESVDPTIIQLSNGTIWIVYAAKKVAPPQPGFEISADPSSVTISAGTSGNSTITVLSFVGFSSAVDLSYSFRAFPPQNITASFNPDPVTPPPNGEVNSTMTIYVGPTVAANTYTITVKGDSINPAYNDTVAVSVTVPSHLSAGGSSGTEFILPSDSEPQSLDNYEIYYKASHDGGETWSSERSLTENTADDMTPAVLQAVNGTLWLVWTSMRTGNTEIFYKVSSDLGVTWSNDTQLTVDSHPDERPSIVQMQDGRIWVAWHSNRFDDNNEIMYKIYNGASWSADYRLTTLTTKDDTSPSLLQTADGVIWVFWAQYDTTVYDTADIYYVQSSNNGGSWSSPPTRLTTHAAEDLWPNAVQSDDSRVWVAWTSNRTGNWDIYYRNSLVHNLAVTDVEPSPLQVYQMENVSVSATVHNFGDFGESFTVNCYANTTLVDSHIASLGSGSWVNLVLSWNTSGFSRGNYYVTVEAVPVSGEVYTDDNTMIHGTVHVKFLGDVNDSGFVNVLDMFSLGKAFGSIPGSPNWNEEADMNGDSAVTSDDLSRLVGNFGKAA